MRLLQYLVIVDKSFMFRSRLSVCLLVTSSTRFEDMAADVSPAVESA
jgi:hypothetical protein